MAIDMQKDNLTIWYDEPAQDAFTSAIPVGNGYLGAMVYGNVETERISLNEGTFWSGGPGHNNKPEAAAYLGQARQLLFAGRYKEAEAIVSRHMIGGPECAFMPAGRLLIHFPGHLEPQDYSRSLDLRTAIARVSYRSGGIGFVREVFASYPDRILVIRLTADQPQAISCSLGYSHDLADACVSAGSDACLLVDARGEDWHGIEGRVRMQIRMHVAREGGTVQSDGQQIHVSGADTVTIHVAIGTNFVSADDLSGDPAAITQQVLASLQGKSDARIRADHISDYRNLFDRVELDLDPAGTWTGLTTDKRIAGFVPRQDLGLVVQYYQFGRYLLIASSRPGGQPANLQGIWNEDMQPAWDSKYTTNINYEMNYWPSFTANLAPCSQPFFSKLKNLVTQGRKTAREHYGMDRGWVLHHNTDLWNRTAPIDGPWGFTPADGAWLCNQAFDMLRFGQSRDDLAELYPVMKEAADFFLAYLVPYQDPDGQTWLVTAPSASPENLLRAGFDSSTCFAPAMDSQILRDLFDNCLAASRQLGIDQELAPVWQAARDQLPPDRVGRWGQLQEWYGDWDWEADDHRHFSHLYGLFPSCQITPETTPDLAAAARTTLNGRGDMSTGWSLAWKINVWARLQDGNRCGRLIDLLLSPERTYPNLFDAHPPFQIDGNFGAVSGINEMLVQSHQDVIRLLPALPDTWRSGRVRGILARGGFEIEQLQWAEGRLQGAVIRSKSGYACTVRYGEKTLEFATRPGMAYRLDSDLNLSAVNLFWDLFGPDYRANCLAWHHSPHNPVMPAGQPSWKQQWTANPDVLPFAGRQLIYYRGHGTTEADPVTSHDRIAVAELLEVTPEQIRYRDLNDGDFIIDVGKAGEFDDREVLDPAAVVFQGKVFLYYSAIGHGPDSVGLAISEDGVHFAKHGKVLTGRAPDVLVKDGQICMIYQKECSEGYKGFYLADSADGIHFTERMSEPVFLASGHNNWDCQIATARLFEQEGVYYMLYGGNPSKIDQPDYFGLARSTDLVSWERHPGNPIFGCGPKGAEDGGAIWFPALIGTAEGYAILYEGARGDYNWAMPSQICQAWISHAEPCRGTAWH